MVTFGWITHFTSCVCATFQKQCLNALCLISIMLLYSGIFRRRYNCVEKYRRSFQM